MVLGAFLKVLVVFGSGGSGGLCPPQAKFLEIFTHCSGRKHKEIMTFERTSKGKYAAGRQKHALVLYSNNLI